LKKCTATIAKVVMAAYYMNPNNVHVKSEKIYASTGQDTIHDPIEKAGKVEKKKYV
jgi:hypothetical protein